MTSAKLDQAMSNPYTLCNRRPRYSASAMRNGGVSFSLIAAGLLLLSACQTTPTPQITAPAATAAPPTSVLLPSTPQPVPIASSTPTETVFLAHGMLERIEMDNPPQERPLFASVYFPPQYAAFPDSHFPVLYLLHGLLADDQQWIELGIPETADMLIAAGQIPAYIIVMPWEQNGGDFERSVVDTLIPYIDSHYRTIAEPDFRAIGGLSRGGGWAVRIGLHYPDQFASIGLHSPANFTSAPYFDYWINHAGVTTIPRIWLDIGEQDSLLASTQDLTAAFDMLAIPYELQISPGNHVTSYWSRNLATYLEWYGEPWSGASEEDVPTS
ncbi:MAG: hypothetical protein JXA97_02145 [Anaerolineales bacterium]|nr:hypothetical protein [Anaerolineales bacterium]